MYYPTYRTNVYDAPVQMTQSKSFNPIDFNFEWTADGWYTWDHKAARAAAMSARNALAKALEKDGWTVRKFSTPNQLCRRGGIGSGHPDIEHWVTVYEVYATKTER